MSYSDRIARAIEREGELVDIENYGTKTYSDYGDLVSQITSNLTNVRAVFNQYGKKAMLQTEGIFEEGDVTFFFKGDQPGVLNDNIIVRQNGERWKIMAISEHYGRGVKTHIEASTVQDSTSS
jgi:hypothetical protein